MKNPTDKKSNATDSKADHARDYGNDPYFVKKANKSKAFLEKHGFAKELVDKKQISGIG
ncbi:hypothetical protein [Parapedobacter defluvii]|nr:hypothetical protein [Parapedobacter defluvii]